jgi:FMN phosphatase YigB (HAD superfamily)
MKGHGWPTWADTIVTMATQRHDVVYLLDVDNTLLDNDTVIEDLRRHLVEAIGMECAQQYWELFEQCRRELGYADYLGALQRYRVRQPYQPQVLRLSLFLLHYPFATRLYPNAMTLIDQLHQRGTVVILTDGDVVFQPRKVERSGLWAAVNGEVLIYVHKELMLDDVEARYPAHRYVMVDDKLWILAAMKTVWGNRLRTVFVQQGHYAHDSRVRTTHPPADLTVETIGHLLGHVGTL